MRIGELLVEQKKLRRSDLDRVVAEQKPDRRLCSLLIASGLVEFDDAARALGEQKGVPCALAKHLEGRDPELAKLIPAELGRASCALPIGRTSRGSLIVCVRDPEPALLATLKTAAKTDVLMVIAPAQRLEHLIEAAYGASPDDELDVDFDSSGDVAPPPAHAPPLPDMDALDPDSVRLALTDLDDARVDKDPSQSGQFSTQTPPGGVNRMTRPSDPPPRARTEPPRTTLPPPPPSLDSTRAALEGVTSRDAATDRVLAYLAGRWVTGLVLAIREGSAIGYRGVNVKLPEMVAIELDKPSTVHKALETRRTSSETASGPAQAALLAALANPRGPVVAPVLVRGLAVAVLAVGDPIAGPGDAEDAIDALTTLAELLGATYERVLGGR